MTLDPITISVVNIFSAGLLGIALLAVSQGYLKQIQSIYKWALASLLHSLAWILYSLNGVLPDYLCIILPHAFMLLSLAFYFKIIAQFTGEVKRTHWVYPLIAAAIASSSFFLWVKPDGSVRVVIISAAVAILLYASAYTLLFKTRKSPTSHKFTGTVFAFVGSIFLFRFVYYLVWIPTPTKICLPKTTCKALHF
jgi:hypothetical protein